MLTYFKDKHYESKRRSENYKTLTSILESVDAVVIFGAATTFETFLVVHVGLIVVPITAGIAFASSLVIKVIHIIIMNKYNK